MTIKFNSTKLYTVLVLVLAIILSFYIFNNIKNNMSKYIYENAVNISDSNIFKSKLITKKGQIYLAGEVHGTCKNSEVEVLILKNLIENNNVKYYIGEFSYSTAYLINQYLSGEDPKAIQRLIEAYKQNPGNYIANIEFVSKWTRIKSINDKLPSDKKIMVIGIDAEYNEEIALYVVKNILDDDSLSLIELISSDSFINAKSDKKINVENIIKNLEYANELSVDKNYKSHHNKRDRIMYENFKNYKLDNSEYSYFGQFGYLHTYKSRQFGIDWLGSLINSDDIFNNQVVSIQIEYISSERIDKSGNRKDLDFDNTLNSLNLSFNSDILLDLTKNNSPFFKNSAFGDTSLIEPNTNYIDYVLILSDSKAITPIEWSNYKTKFLHKNNLIYRFAI